MHRNTNLKILRYFDLYPCIINAIIYTYRFRDSSQWACISAQGYMVYILETSTHRSSWNITGYTEFTTHKENGVHKKWWRHAKSKLVFAEWRLQYGTVFFKVEKKLSVPIAFSIRLKMITCILFLPESVLMYTI